MTREQTTIELMESNSMMGWSPVAADRIVLVLDMACKSTNLSREVLLEKIDREQVQYRTGLYYEPVYIISRKLYDAAQKRAAEAKAKIQYVKCSCGHTVPKSSVMSASMGSSCPDCYDRMSY
jgi:hypothetical protein